MAMPHALPRQNLGLAEPPVELSPERRTPGCDFLLGPAIKRTTQVRSDPLLGRGEAERRTRRGQKSAFAYSDKAHVDGGQRDRFGS